MIIDIDASLVSVQETATFWVEFEEDGPALEVTVDQRKQRRLLNRYIRASIHREAGDEEVQDINVQPEFYDLGLALVEFVVGWRGFAGAFDREKVKRFLTQFGSYAEAFGQQFKGMLDAYDEQVLQYKDAAAKN
jgi:hypothetical protein